MPESNITHIVTEKKNKIMTWFCDVLWQKQQQMTPGTNGTDL